MVGQLVSQSEDTSEFWKLNLEIRGLGWGGWRSRGWGVEDKEREQLEIPRILLENVNPSVA